MDTLRGKRAERCRLLRGSLLTSMGLASKEGSGWEQVRYSCNAGIAGGGGFQASPVQVRGNPMQTFPKRAPTARFWFCVALRPLTTLRFPVSLLLWLANGSN